MMETPDTLYARLVKASDLMGECWNEISIHNTPLQDKGLLGRITHKGLLSVNEYSESVKLKNSLLVEDTLKNFCDKYGYSYANESDNIVYHGLVVLVKTKEPSLLSYQDVKQVLES